MALWFLSFDDDPAPDTPAGAVIWELTGERLLKPHAMIGRSVDLAGVDPTLGPWALCQNQTMLAQGDDIWALFRYWVAGHTRRRAAATN